MAAQTIAGEVCGVNVTLRAPGPSGQRARAARGDFEHYDTEPVNSVVKMEFAENAVPVALLGDEHEPVLHN